MSVQMNTYVMWGVLLPFKEFADREDFEPYMDSAFKGIHHHDGLCVLADGMDGKYMAIGHVLHKTSNHDGFNKPIQLHGQPVLEFDVYERVEKLIGRQLTGNEGPSWLVLTHYR